MIRLVIAVEDQLLGESLCVVLSGVDGLECYFTTPFSNRNPPDEFLDPSRPPVILLELNPGSVEEEPVLARIKAVFTEGRILLLADKYPPGADVETLSRGIQGIFHKTSGLELLKRAITAVDSGEVWAERQTTSRLISKLAGVKFGLEGADQGGAGLTRREKQILALVAGGLKNHEIGDKLYISERTVKVHLNRIFKKIRVKDRLQAALYAIHNDFIPGKIAFPEAEN